MDEPAVSAMERDHAETHGLGILGPLHKIIDGLLDDLLRHGQSVVALIVRLHRAIDLHAQVGSQGRVDAAMLQLEGGHAAMAGDGIRDIGIEGLAAVIGKGQHPAAVSPAALADAAAADADRRRSADGLALIEGAHLGHQKAVLIHKGDAHGSGEDAVAEQVSARLQGSEEMRVFLRAHIHLPFCISSMRAGGGGKP